LASASLRNQENSLEHRPPPLPFIQQRFQLFHRYRCAEQMALKSRSAAQFKKLVLHFGFDAFGITIRPSVSHRNDGLHMLKIA
jgi:hypothetical protein